MPLVRYEVTGYGIALYGLTVEHSAQPGVLGVELLQSAERCRVAAGLVADANHKVALPVPDTGRRVQGQLDAPMSVLLVTHARLMLQPPLGSSFG